MLFEEVNFNASHFKGWTEAEFVKHESHHGLSKEQLKEAFALIPQAVKEERKAEKEAETEEAAGHKKVSK